jgi:hypothetical protein
LDTDGYLNFTAIFNEEEMIPVKTLHIDGILPVKLGG